MSGGGNTSALGRGAWWEKRGNTSWVSCGACDNWFHVALAMLGERAPRLHCPKCHAEFAAGEASHIIVAE